MLCSASALCYLKVPHITLRDEFIFAERVYSVLSLSLGTTIGVF